MSSTEPLTGSSPQVGVASSPQLNVGTNSAVCFQQLLGTSPQNLNVLSAAGQQFVITSQVSVPGLSQMLPTIATSNMQQGGVTRIVNISPQQRVVNRGTLQLTSPGTFVALSSSAASHPTLVTSLATPVRQPMRIANLPVVQAASRKRTKLFDTTNITFPNDERGCKRVILDSKLVKLNNARSRYAESAAELFFLQSNNCIIDFYTWKSKKHNTPQFCNFLKSNKLDREDDDEDLTNVLTSGDSENDIKTIATTVPLTVAPPPVQIQQQQQMQHQQLQHVGVSAVNRDVRLQVPHEKKSPVKQNNNKLMLNPMVRQHTRQHSISAVYDTSIGSQEQIVEKAKQEAYVVQRVNELQREGLWSEKRLPKVQEPPRNKAHWDYLLEEMVWLAADFAQERKWKKANAKKCAKMVQKYFQDKAVLLKKEEKSQELRLRKLANFMAKEVKNFWANVNKLVEYKQTTRLEEKRKKALDQHLSFIVDQTEKYSTWLAESMNKTADSGQNSVSCSRRGSDDDFEPNVSSSDDEETIAKEEANTEQITNNVNEIEELKRDGELPLEDLLRDLPDDYWENINKFDPGGVDGETSRDDGTKSDKSEDFTVDSDKDTSDDEETMEEQEKTEGKVDHKVELAELAVENEMSVEELRAKYSGPLPPSQSEDVDNEDDANVQSEDEDEEEDEDEDEEEEEDDEEDEDEEMDSDSATNECKEIGLKSLMEDENITKDSNEQANKEISDVAAIAESLQPKGNTLLTTCVATPIPFLLKHKLREYQHIGLDWLVTMFDRKLNGILADEMGLGKTIQTIALLSHLACEKGNWGPHLIIVPTSVMLNWEMEFKKWCPAFKILTYYGTQKERKQKRVGWTKPNAFHICITSYKLVIQDHQSFRRKKWKYLILDEAQNIKNFKSQRWQLLLNFQTQRRLLLTGTPLQNNLMELWSLMHFLMPNVFQSHKEFKEWFSNPVTGMIEGSSEYNENIIKRLHKVLRPFLLRRLKTEVEKQLPKKYEHVVMCRLSKRQRYLYDDFMSRAKTKETLATGNLLSVINVLMQLRKVCNHPNLFEVRPIISSFLMDSITYVTASLVANALVYDPFTQIDLSFLNLLFIQLESMTVFASYRMKKTKTPRKLIEELDVSPKLAPRCPSSRFHYRVRVPDKKNRALQQLADNKNILSVMPPVKVGTSPGVRIITLPGTDETAVALKVGGSELNVIRQDGSIKCVQQKPSSTPVKSEQLHLGGLPVHLVHTSTGRPHIYIPLQTQQSSTATTVTATKTTSGTPAKVNVLNGQTLSGLMGTSVTTRTSTSLTSPVTATKTELESCTQIVPSIPEVDERIKVRRRDKLSLIAFVNDYRCDAYPMYGSDMISVMRIVDGEPPRYRGDNDVCWWRYCGSANMSNRQYLSYWNQTSYLSELVKSHTQLVDSISDILSRFVLFVPAVVAPRLQFHCSHLSPSTLWKEKSLVMSLSRELSPRCDVLHSVSSSMATQFPDPRLIQYDCGKLQVLDKLLRELKSKSHRVLLFTQMTRMLDVLEAFLNYHGHIYLRLDGTTKVDQRQVLMERFNNDKRIFCFILSTRSGGIGVNLTGADTVVFYDSDWNPTMDAQAQDRCHRIGQTRDVHIYRLVSEMTVEENILKKANQKRMLGDLAIEGGNFTTAYFKSSTIQDLFNVDVNEQDASRRMSEVLRADRDRKKKEENETMGYLEEKTVMGVLENALAAAEDDTDVQAARTAKAEAAAELAEFDENIPLDDDGSAAVDAVAEVSKAELEVNLLVEQLTPIERYAMRFVEENEAAWSAEQLAAAEAQIEQQKREWELDRLQALKAEEERRLQEEEVDQDLLTYSREDALNQVWMCDDTKETMPMWCPPTPPQDENDIYIDQSMCFLYEPYSMLDTQLPPVYVKKEIKRTRAADVTSMTEGRRPIKMQRREEILASAPRSLFDHPSSALQKMRRDMKLQKYRGLMRPHQVQNVSGHKPMVTTKPSPEQENIPEWTIQEDYILLQSIEKIQELHLNLMVMNPAHIPNWDMVADMVNFVLKTSRSPSQCRSRYENVIIPREEGKIVQDTSRKQKKTKSVYKSPVGKSNRPIKTLQLYVQDNNASFTEVYHSKFENIQTLANKRKPTVKPLLVNPMMKNPKHAAVLDESGIDYDSPVNPVEIATKRAERIAKEKQKISLQQPTPGQILTGEQLTPQQLLQRQQMAAAVAAAKSASQTATVIPFANSTAKAVVVTAAGGTVAASTTAQVVPVLAVSTTVNSTSNTNIVVAQSLATSLVQTGNITTLSPGLRQTRPVTAIPVGLQEIVAASQARTVNTPTTVVSVASLTQAQIQAARIAASSNLMSTVTVSGAATPVKVAGSALPTTAATAAKNVSPQLQYYRQQAIFRQQQQRVTALRDPQLKVIQAQPTAVTGTTSAISQSGVTTIQQQKVTAVTTVSGVSAVQPGSPSQQKTQFIKQTTASITKRPEEMAALMKQHLQRQQQKTAAAAASAGGAGGGAIATTVTVTQQPALTAQILAQAGLQVQTGSQQQVATLVKTTASGQSVTIPMTGITIPQVKATLNQPIKTPTGTTQIRQLGINYQQLLSKQGRMQGTKVAQIAKPGLQTQLIVQSQGGKAVPTISMQHIQQVMKNVQPQHITVSSGQPVLQQGNQVVLAKSPQLNSGTVQTRVIPVSSSQSARQTIQVVPGTALRAVPNVTIDTTGRPQVPAGIVRAGMSPLRIQSSTASGTPLMAVTVQQASVQVRTTQPQDNNQLNQS